jgi:hypothetical protein
MTTTEYHTSKEGQIKKINKVIQTIAHADPEDQFMEPEKRDFIINKLSKVCNFINMQREGMYEILDSFEFKGEYDHQALPHAAQPHLTGKMRKNIHLLFQELSEVIGEVKKDSGLTVVNAKNEKLDDKKRKQLMEADEYIITEINAILSNMNEPEPEKPMDEKTLEEKIEPKYELQEEDIINNPDLKEAGLKVGDKIDIPVEILESMDLQKGSEVHQVPEPTPPVVGNVPEGTGSVVVSKEEIEKQNASTPKIDRKTGKDLKR